MGGKRRKQRKSPGPLDLDAPAARGKALEWAEIEEWLPTLRREGYTAFYSGRTRQGRLPRGTQDYPDWLRAAFPESRRRPDLVARHRNGREFLVGDVTAGPWSETEIRSGGHRRLPHDIDVQPERRPHLDKTIEDAEQLARALPDDVTVHAQDRYREARGRTSQRIDVTALLRRRRIPRAVIPPAGSVPPQPARSGSASTPPAPVHPAPSPPGMSAADPASPEPTTSPSARRAAPDDVVGPPPPRSRLQEGRPTVASRGVREPTAARPPLSRYREAVRAGLHNLVWEAAGLALEFWQIHSQIERVEREVVAARALRRGDVYAQMLAELSKPENVRLFEARPFDQFWFQVTWHEIFEAEAVRNRRNPLSTDVVIVDVRVEQVRVVAAPGEPTLTDAPMTPDMQGHRQRVLYEPVFAELTHGQELAARRVRLPDRPTSHGVTWRQWLLVARDYVLYARSFPELRHLADDAWARFRLELCGISEAADMFTPQELEACKDERLLMRVSRERGTW